MQPRGGVGPPCVVSGDSDAVCRRLMVPGFGNWYFFLFLFFLFSRDLHAASSLWYFDLAVTAMLPPYNRKTMQRGMPSRGIMTDDIRIKGQKGLCFPS